jgi:glutathione S-transferase
MILIGQYDSPFVRRVGIALVCLELPFEHWPWSSFGDAEKLRAFNPLTRVPTLVLDDGDVLVDSHMMLDHLDGLAGPDRAMFPRVEPARRRALKVAALATGIADKAVALFYEQRLHAVASEAWVARCRAQMSGGLAALEQDRAARPGAAWFGGAMGHEDVAVAVMLRFIAEALPGAVDMADYPALAAHAERHEAMPVFRNIRQAFVPPA